MIIKLQLENFNVVIASICIVLEVGLMRVKINVQYVIRVYLILKLINNYLIIKKKIMNNKMMMFNKYCSNNKSQLIKFNKKKINKKLKNKY